MLIFRNPGLIDLEAVRTLGVSVKRAGSFGRFGTGLKFAIATILRGGGEIAIYRGLESHTLGTVEKEVRGQAFQIVTLDGESMGITTSLGRDWEPWMVLRELGCNAIDEGGSFDCVASASSVDNSNVEQDAEQTVIVVRWDDLDSAYRQRKDLFLEGEPLWSSPRLRILSGPSAHIFYRGVRVYKLDKPAAFTYDILDEQRLTEDRTLIGTYGVDGIIRDTFLTMQDKTIIAQAITAGDNYHESKLDYENASWGVKPGRAFLDAAVEARESNKLKNPSAKKVLLRHIRSSAEEKSTYGSYRRVKDDALTYAIEQLTSIGITFDESVKFVFIDEMPGPDTLSMVEDGRIYLLQDMVDQGARVIAEQLIARWVDLKNDSYDAEGVVKLMIPILLGKLPDLKQDESLVKEDELTEEPEPEEGTRFILEGTWSGYNSEQEKVVHREIVSQSIADKIFGHYAIDYTDGTQLRLTLTDYIPGQEIVLKDGYTKLIRDCIATDLWKVQDHVDARRAKEEDSMPF